MLIDRQYRFHQHNCLLHSDLSPLCRQSLLKLWENGCVVVCERVCGGNGEFTSDWDSLASFLSLAALVKTGNSPLSTELHNCTTPILNSYIRIHTTVNYGCSSTIHNQDHVTEKDTKLCSMFSVILVQEMLQDPELIAGLHTDSWFCVCCSKH